MNNNDNFSKDQLRLDSEEEIEKICSSMRDALRNKLKRRGVVIGLSGGIDSSVTAALAVRAFGSERVFALEMPERYSAEDTLDFSGLLIRRLGIRSVQEDITGLLEAVGCYRRYDDALRRVIPEYGQGWKSKLVTSDIMVQRGFTTFSIVAQSPDNVITKKRLPLQAYLEIVAATNFKQRSRKMLEYYHADCLHYCVAGTPNRLEYELGFFVKLGDGAADIKPIAHLYKTQVYQIAKHLNIPTAIITREPTTDTYSLTQGQDEFFFSLPYDKMDLCLFGKNNGVPAAQVAQLLHLSTNQVTYIYEDIDTKRKTTRYLHMPPLLVENDMIQNDIVN